MKHIKRYQSFASTGTDSPFPKITKEELEEAGVILTPGPIGSYYENEAGESVKHYRKDVRICPFETNAHIVYDIWEFIRSNEDKQIFLFWNEDYDSPYHKVEQIYNADLYARSIQYTIRIAIRDKEAEPKTICKKVYKTRKAESKRDNRILLALQ